MPRRGDKNRKRKARIERLKKEVSKQNETESLYKMENGK